MDSASFFTTTEVWRRGGVEEDSSLDGPQRLAASFSVASQEEDQEECGNEDSDDEASFGEVEELGFDEDCFGFLHIGEDESNSSHASLSSKEDEGSVGEEETSSVEHEATPHTTYQSGEAPNSTCPPLFSVDVVLRDGLFFAGFSMERIIRCGEKRNIDRFKAHYGVCPKSVVPFLEDLFKKHPSLKYKDVFMTLNWLKTYSVAHVMAAIWGHCEEYISVIVEEYISKFASLKEGKIRLDRFNDETIIVFSIDACHFMVDEFALSPSTRWYNFKKGDAGLKYEVALSIHTNEIMWIRGPLPASIHDISMFRGRTTEDKKQKKKADENAFIFQIPSGKKGVGDSGCKFD
jgi:hypothetical protein